MNTLPPMATPISWSGVGEGNPYVGLDDPRLLALNLRHAGAGGGSTTEWLNQSNRN